MASYIHKRIYKSGRIAYAVRFKNPFNGKWVQETAGPRRKDAEALKRRIDEEIANGTFGKKKENPMFKEFAEAFIEDKRQELKPSTFRDYQEVIKNHLLPYFGKSHLSQITPSKVLEFIRHMQAKGVSPATTGKVYRVLKVILRRAITLELIDRDPTLAIRPPRVEKREMDFLSKEEVEALLETTEGDIHDIIALAVFSGLRQGEILALRWQDIDFEAGVIRVMRSYHPSSGFTEPKSSYSRRVVPLMPKLVRILKERFESLGGPNPDTLVFPSRAGTPLDRNNLITRDFEPALERAGIRRIRFHDLRHTFASLAIAANMNPKALQQIMGHSSITVTMDTYAHLFPGTHDQAMRKMEALFSAKGQVITLPARQREEGECQVP